LRTIRELKPKVVVLLGGSAVKSLIGIDYAKKVGEITQWIGWTIPSQQFNTFIVPTYHPSYLLRMGDDTVLRRIVRQNLSQAILCESKRLPTCDLNELKRSCDILTQNEDIERCLIDLGTREGICAFDFETDRLKPEHPDSAIVCVSFCIDGKKTIACRIDPTHYNLLADVMRNSKLKKIAQNLKFEHRWSLAVLKTKVRGWIADTMLQAHIEDNRSGITGLKFQTYVRFGIGDYASSVQPYFDSKTPNSPNKIKQVPIRQLLEYCALDSLFEWKLFKLQQKTLELE
jgi:hypothetical protein